MDTTRRAVKIVSWRALHWALTSNNLVDTSFPLCELEDLTVQDQQVTFPTKDHQKQSHWDTNTPYSGMDAVTIGAYLLKEMAALNVHHLRHTYALGTHSPEDVLVRLEKFFRGPVNELHELVKADPETYQGLLLSVTRYVSWTRKVGSTYYGLPAKQPATS